MKRGFTLVEVLFSLAILSVGIMLAADLAISGSQASSYDQRMAQSVQLATSHMEELLVAFPTDARLTAGAHTSYYNASGVAVPAPDVYTASWTVALNTPMAPLMRIQLRVHWTGSSTIGASLQTDRGP